MLPSKVDVLRGAFHLRKRRWTTIRGCVGYSPPFCSDHPTTRTIPPRVYVPYSTVIRDGMAEWTEQRGPDPYLAQIKNEEEGDEAEDGVLHRGLLQHDLDA